MVKCIGDYQLGRTLGVGKFSKVKYCVHRKTKQSYAIKIIDMENIRHKNMEAQLRREIAIMKIVRHKHIINLHEVLQLDDGDICIVMELATGGELFDRIVSARRFTEPVARRYFQQLIVAVEYCHKLKICHRDLKPENLLLDHNDDLKITDFGLSVLVNSRRKQLLSTACGTPNYIAPEVIGEYKYDGMKSDIWSCGVILFVMLAGYLPFDDDYVDYLFRKIEKGKYKMPKHFSPEAKDLISKILRTKPSKRLTIAQIKKHPWFKESGFKEEKCSLPDVSKVNSSALENAVVDSFYRTVDDNEAIDEPESIVNSRLNAFEIASRLIMDDIGTLPVVDVNCGLIVRRNTRFFAIGSDTEVIDRLMKVMEKEQMNPIFKKERMEIRGNFGPVTLGIRIRRTITDNIVWVECYRRQGDILEFQKLYRKIAKQMTDIMANQLPKTPTALQKFNIPSTVSSFHCYKAEAKRLETPKEDKKIIPEPNENIIQDTKSKDGDTLQVPDQKVENLSLKTLVVQEEPEKKKPSLLSRLFGNWSS